MYCIIGVILFVQVAPGILPLESSTAFYELARHFTLAFVLILGGIAFAAQRLRDMVLFSFAVFAVVVVLLMAGVNWIT